MEPHDTIYPIGDGMTTPTHDTTTPDTWNPDVDPFDPVRAGFTGDDPDPDAALSFGMKTKHGTIDLIRAEAVDQWLVMDVFGETLHRDFYIPRTMPDGSPRTHADVLAILRANGYEGGDDE